MRVLKTLVASMMDDSEKFLIPYQKSHALSVLSDTTSSHNDENYDQIPKLYEKKKKERHLLRVDEFMVSNS